MGREPATASRVPFHRTQLLGRFCEKHVASTSMFTATSALQHHPLVPLPPPFSRSQRRSAHCRFNVTDNPHRYTNSNSDTFSFASSPFLSFQQASCQLRFPRARLPLLVVSPNRHRTHAPLPSLPRLNRLRHPRTLSPTLVLIPLDPHRSSQPPPHVMPTPPTSLASRILPK